MFCTKTQIVCTKKIKISWYFVRRFLKIFFWGWGDFVFFRPIIYWNSWNISFFFFVVSDKDR